MFEKSNWIKGSDAISVHPSNRAIDIYDVTIVSVGPRWVNTARKDGRNAVERFDHSGKSEHTFGYAPRLWPSRAAYEADLARQRAWSRLRKMVEGYHPPAHLTTEEIEGIAAALSPEA